LIEINLNELYEKNENFRLYVNRYRILKKKTVEEALQDAIVSLYAEYVVKARI
jgi:hypothetical protein